MTSWLMDSWHLLAEGLPLLPAAFYSLHGCRFCARSRAAEDLCACGVALTGRGTPLRASLPREQDRDEDGEDIFIPELRSRAQLWD